MKRDAIVLVIGPVLPRDVRWGPWAAVSQNTRRGIEDIGSFDVRSLVQGEPEREQMMAVRSEVRSMCCSAHPLGIL